jgi:hypothetical protein
VAVVPAVVVTGAEDVEGEVEPVNRVVDFDDGFTLVDGFVVPKLYEKYQLMLQNNAV